MAVYTNSGMYGEEEVSYVGATLNWYERNGYHDSDFYAEVWDGKKVKTVLFDTTRCGGSGRAEIDASNEIRNLAKKYKAMNKYKHEVNHLKLLKGCMIEVVKGRKVPKGTVSKVVVIKENPYDQFNKKVMIEFDGKNVWTYENNLQVKKPSIHVRINAKHNMFINNDIH